MLPVHAGRLAAEHGQRGAVVNPPRLVHRYDAAGAPAGEFEVGDSVAEVETRKERVVVSWPAGVDGIDRVIDHIRRGNLVTCVTQARQYETRSSRRATRLIQAHRRELVILRVDDDDLSIVYEWPARRPDPELSVAAPTVEQGAALMRDLGAGAIAGWLPEMCAQLEDLTGNSGGELL